MVAVCGHYAVLAMARCDTFQLWQGDEELLSYLKPCRLCEAQGSLQTSDCPLATPRLTLPELFQRVAPVREVLGSWPGQGGGWGVPQPAAMIWEGCSPSRRAERRQRIAADLPSSR